MVSTIYQVTGVKVLSENMEFQNENIGDNGSKTASFSEISADRLTDEFSGISSF
jgi:hypothetical protein